MTNRFEREFPSVRWQAVPPRGVDHEPVRRAIERGRQLRSEAIRRSGRAAAGALCAGLARAVTLVRCTALSLAGRTQAAECWRGSPRRA